MKRTIKIFAMLLAFSIAVVCCAACGDGLTSGGSAKGASDIQISDPEFGFVKSEEYDPDIFDIETAHKWTKLDVDSEYYLILTFDVTSMKNNDGQSLLNVDITFDALDIMDGTMEDVSTGLIEEMTFVDAGSGKYGKTTTVSFKIPPISTEPKTINMIVSLRPMQLGESHIIIGYRFDPSTTMDSADSYKLLGSDGYTKNLTIQTVQIEAPVLSVNEMGFLTWKHVKNADYYQVFETGQPLTDYTGKEVIQIAEGYAIGGDIIFNVGDSIQPGYHSFTIRACSNNPNITMSNFSNSVEYTW